MNDQLRKRYTFNSIRAYRRFTDDVARQCYRGERDFADATRAAAIAKVGAELLMVEMTLAAEGGLDMEPGQHPHGDTGGLDLGRPGVFVERTDSEKGGISAKGTPISETKVQTRAASQPRALPEEF